MSNPLSFLNGSLHLRYTPPTCTLDITAKRSPLSRWTNQPTLKDLRFELSFDDPRLPAEKRIVVQGDRVLLDLLFQAVTDYVQNFLQQSSDLLNERFLSPSILDRHVDSTSDLMTVSGSRYWHQESATPYLPDTGNGHAALIYLKPSGLVAHDLILGPLATVQSGPWISLGAIQLFDLAAALDEYAACAMTLPDLEIDRPKVRPAVWAGAGAAAAILVVGLTSSFLRFYQTPQTTASAPVAQTPQPPSTLPPLASIPVPTPEPPPPLSARQATPTPTPTATPTPTPTPQASPTSPPPAPRLEAPTEVKPTPIPIPSDTPTVQTTPEGQSRQSLQIPGDTADSPPPPQSPSPPLLQQESQPQLQLQPQPQPQLQQELQPPLPPPTGAPILVAPEPPPLRPITPVDPNAGLPSSFPTLPPADESSSAKNGLPQLAGEDLDAARSNARLPGSNELNVLEDEASSPPSVFNVTPQVGEVKSYFQDRWKPVEGLTLTLEYTLVLNPDGTLQQAIPLGHTAENYIERTGIPLPGAAIASPSRSAQPPHIRLVLGADGEVSTFLED